MSEEDRELISDLSKRSCSSCNAGDIDTICGDYLIGPDTGLPNMAWNCWHPKGTILIVYEKPAFCHERFVCAICRREVGGVLGDVRSAQPSRQEWCLRCGVKAERAGAGVKGPGIAVWDERPYESTV